MAAAAQAPMPDPERCQLGGGPGARAGRDQDRRLVGRRGVGLPAHVEEALINVRSVFIANEELGGLAAYVNR